mmetsp:Transcript_58644/g.96823  ORF Transcript_58644/g.96823 Transcript_58644/m.96823 type:complete len:191 (+) Transcript_58644:31-603(+)
MGNEGVPVKCRSFDVYLRLALHYAAIIDSEKERRTERLALAAVSALGLALLYCVRQQRKQAQSSTQSSAQSSAQSSEQSSEQPSALLTGERLAWDSLLTRQQSTRSSCCDDDFPLPEMREKSHSMLGGDCSIIGERRPEQVLDSAFDARQTDMDGGCSDGQGSTDSLEQEEGIDSTSSFARATIMSSTFF